MLEIGVIVVTPTHGVHVCFHGSAKWEWPFPARSQAVTRVMQKIAVKISPYLTVFQPPRRIINSSGDD